MTIALDRVDPAALAAAAERARLAFDVTLPALAGWNSSPCAEHAADGVQQNCKRCGVLLKAYQRVGISWMFLVRHALLADQVGLGKTVQAAGLIALMRQSGELDVRHGGGRVLVVCRPAALGQWHGELTRMLPSLSTAIASGSRVERSDVYAAPWEVALVGHQAYLRDVEVLEQLRIHALLVDDVDPIRDCDNKTAWAIKRMATKIPRTMLLTGTPLQKNLLELYDLFDVIGKARLLFGPRELFIRRYLKREKVIYHTPAGKKRVQFKVVGVRNLEEFKSKIAPVSLRRTADDVEGLDLPSVLVDNVSLDLHPPQRVRYDELAAGVLRLIRVAGEAVSQVAAAAKMHYAAKICESLAVLDDVDVSSIPASQHSVKFDWIVDKLLGDWSGESLTDPGEKVVVFIHYRGGLEALGSRLDAAGIGNVRIWGAERDPRVRAAAQERFWSDDSCRVLLGTSAIEQSLNLQCSRRLVSVDRIPNPGRMNQLAGRVRRGGSRFRTVYVHNLVAVDTHEERQLRANRTEAAIASAVWEESDVLHGQLSPLELMQLIAPAVRARAVGRS